MTTERRGKWHPSPAQIELVLDCVNAKVPLERAAELLDIGPRSLWLFARRVGSPSIFAIWKDRPRHEAISRVRVAARTPEMHPASEAFPAAAPHASNSILPAAFTGEDSA
jgi:hypothetical protein